MVKDKAGRLASGSAFGILYMVHTSVMVWIEYLMSKISPLCSKVPLWELHIYKILRCQVRCTDLQTISCCIRLIKGSHIMKSVTGGLEIVTSLTASHNLSFYGLVRLEGYAAPITTIEFFILAQTKNTQRQLLKLITGSNE